MIEKNSERRDAIFAESVPELPARRLVFAMVYSFADISKVYAEIPPIMNKAVLDLCQKNKLRIRVDKKDIKPESCSMEFEGDLDFRLDVGQQAMGAQFSAPKSVPTAVKLLKEYARATLELLSERGLLPPQNVEAVSLEIAHKFRITDPQRKNRHIVNEKLIRGLGDAGSVFGDLVSSLDGLGRVDLKFSSRTGGGHWAFISVECPGNQDYGTIWPSYNCRTGEDAFPADVQELGSYMCQFVDEAYNGFVGGYAKFLERLLSGEQIEPFETGA